ncbi:MAG: hypothetical protein IIC56_08530, partial [Proteobacteria bacterium]|nr:hypothetical protein [Pseudomonadota bacterium]
SNPLTKKINDKGWRVRDLSARKPNLEDYYLQLFRETDEAAPRATA